MYPSVILKNQFGEESNNAIIGGSSQLRAKFTVTPTNASGITSLVAQGIASVYMHTSTTPTVGSPNPANGFIVVNFSKGFTSLQSLQSTVIPPQSGASLLVASAGLTVGNVYVITILGTTSQAQWEVLGVPAGVTAALGLAFVALATSCTGTGAVQIPDAAGTAIVSISPVGNPSVASLPDGSGGQIVLACYGVGGAVAAHTHSFLVKGGQAAAGTDAISIKGSAPVVVGKEAATDNTALGGTNGGVQNTTASFTGANAVAAPATGSVIELCFNVIPLPASLI